MLSEGRILYDNVWNIIGHTLASITTINTDDNTVLAELPFENEKHPSLMQIENNTIYYVLDNKIYVVDSEATSLPTTELIELEGYVYGFEIKGSEIFTLDTSFTDLSKLNVFQ